MLIFGQKSEVKTQNSELFPHFPHFLCVNFKKMMYFCSIFPEVCFLKNGHKFKNTIVDGKRTEHRWGTKTHFLQYATDGDYQYVVGFVFDRYGRVAVSDDAQHDKTGKGKP